MRLYHTASLIGLAAGSQIPLVNMPKQEFALKQGPDIFSAQDLVELGRPSDGVANIAGDLVLVSYSKYSTEEKKNEKSIYIAPLESSVAPLHIRLAKGGEAFWIDTRTVAHVVEGDNKDLEIYTISLDFETQAPDYSSSLVSDPPTLIGSLPTPGASNFRYASSGHLVFSADVYDDGNLTAVKENDELWEKRDTSALVYDNTFERHWDKWVLPKRSSLFSVPLQKGPDQVWHIGTEFTNVLKGTGHSCPVEPFGGTDDFDVSPNGIVYTTKDPKLPPAWHTKQNVYIIDILGVTPPKELTSGRQGATHGPVFNAQHDKVAWLELATDGYESDRATIVIYDLKTDVRFTLTQKWDRSPDALAWSKEGTFIYLTAGDEAKVKVFVLPVPPTPAKSTTDPVFAAKYVTPVALTHKHAASGLQTLFGGRLIFTQSSLTSPKDVWILRGLGELEHAILQSDAPVQCTQHPEQVTNFTATALRSKNLGEGEEFWFKGANDVSVQGWVIKPRGWTEGQKYPVILLIHGGPQGAWEDNWSTRWNPNVFAQQGYFVVFINPTGSTTFGQKFVDAITGNWGSLPFEDLSKGWAHVLKSYPEIDPERAVAAGASWGGYAINWIQGHQAEYGFNFKALVAHDGVFDAIYNGFTTDELFFFNHDWTGRPWESHTKELAQKYSPSNFVHKWSTPQLLIHGSKDYRLPETESIGPFHALQQLGIPTRLVIFPDENHWVQKHGNSLKWHYEVFRWFDQFVGDSK